MMAYAYLAVAIIGEVAATSALKACEEFTKLIPSLIVLVGYAVALFFLCITLRSIPVGIAYAIWAGAGTFFIALTSYLVYGQTLNSTAILGMCLIAIGVALVKGAALQLG